MAQNDPSSPQPHEEKPAGQKENDLLFWISAGAIIVIGLGAIGYILIKPVKSGKKRTFSHN
jgi:hypothetical protein